MLKRVLKPEGKMETKANDFERFYLLFDIILLIISFLSLIASYFYIFPLSTITTILVIVTIVNLLPILISALRSLLRFKLTIDLLASVALIAAVLNKEWHSAVFVGMMLVSARIFMRYTDNRARRAIESLLKLRPSRVHLKIDGRIVEVGTEEVKVGDSVLVEVGERIPVDGVIESGEGSIDQSSLTGESEPVPKAAGDSILSSTLIVAGSLVIKATRVGKDTTFAKIVNLVEKSQAAKAPISSNAERFASWYILATLVGATAIYFFSHNLAIVLSVLLVTCADDLAVAIPLSFTAGINAAAKKGVIVKGGIFLEGFPKIKIFVFDKTGTITMGKPRIETVKTFNGFSEKEFLEILGAIEGESQHPTAKAIKKFLEGKDIKIPDVENFYEKPGYGNKGIINGENVFAGKVKFLEDNGVNFSKEESEILNKEKDKGHSVTVLGVNGKTAGFISFEDTIRPGQPKLSIN